MDSSSTLICPNCRKKISIDQAVKSQLEEKIRQSLRDEYNAKWQTLQKEQEEKTKKDQAVLAEQLEKQKKEIAEFRENELALRKKTQELEEKEKNLELEKQRQIDEERKKIQEKTESMLTEKFRLKEKEYEQNMEAMKRSLEETQRKANQGSQQLQGEVLELELEETLKQEFPIDEIVPVPKGFTGADVIQTVKDFNGINCGVIIWESKRTKDWQESWIQKLKDNQRSIKADIAIIISTVLPEGIRNFDTREGVYITSFAVFISLARILRSSLIDLNKTRLSMVNKSSKEEILYSYVSGKGFKQRFEAITEAFTSMKGDLEKEKQLYTRVWAKREAQIQRVIDNALGMYGDLQGLMGSSLPEIKLLEDAEQDLIGAPEE